MLVPVFGNVAHAVLRALADGHVGNVLAAERDLARRLLFKARQRVDKLRLAVALDTGKTDNLAPAHLKVHVLDGVILVELRGDREVLDLQRYWQPEFQKNGFINFPAVRAYSDRLIEQYDVRSGQGSSTVVRSMSGGNQQKAIVAREIDKNPELLVAVQPTRGLDVGAIEYIHKQLVSERDAGKGVLLVSLELDEVMNVSDRILVMYEGEIVGEFDPKNVTVEELGLYMAGAKRM